MCLVFLQKNEHLFNGLFDNNNMSIDEGDEHMDDSFINKIKEADGYKKNKDWSNAAEGYFEAQLYNESSKMYELSARDCDEPKKSAEFLENAANVMADENNDNNIQDINFCAGLYVRAAKLYKKIGMKEKEQLMLSNAMSIYDYYEYEVVEEII